MEVQLKEELNLDKSDWTLVKFGDVVAEVRESTNDAVDEGLTHIVGLEHIDAENIHLRRSAGIDESTTFTKKFGVGDLLFGRRRAYLKKAAQAPFAGICSGDITVMRVKGKRLLPELLPFVVNNDKFFDYAVKHSAGGLSPRVKFKDLANYEFLLPPKDQQAQLAELLWAMDEVVERERTNEVVNQKLYESEREFELFMGNSSSNLKYVSKLKSEVNEELKFIELGEFLMDIRYGTSKKANNNQVGIPVIGIPNVVNEKLTLESLNFVELTSKEFKATKLSLGDIVIVRTNGNPEYTGRSAIYNIEENHVFASYLIKISVNTNIFDPEFLVRYLQTRTIRRYFKRHATSTAGNYNINTETIKSVPVPIWTLDEQRRVVKKLNQIEEVLVATSHHKDSSQNLQRSLINQIF